MKVLLDTNIIIYKEVNAIYNADVHKLYYWLDKLKYDKCISPLTVEEIKKYKDKGTVKIFLNKMNSYECLPEVSKIDNKFLSIIESIFPTKDENDVIDNTLLWKVASNKVDIFITEDKKILKKARCLRLNDKVLNIEDFLYIAKRDNPQFVDYKVLSVKKVPFRYVDIKDNFFDNFKKDYPGFESWFSRKKDEPAYVCYEGESLLGFLYMKVEGPDEIYDDIYPQFEQKKRLKIGTFKVNSSGFRLGERFIKIIFDNAKIFDVDEIYVTLFDKREELERLSFLMKKWGFCHWGTKKSIAGEEIVLVKKMKIYEEDKNVVYNFPHNKNINDINKCILPIYADYHSDLLPDAKMVKEKLDLENLAHRYALEKIYITKAFNINIKPGDIILFYRMGPEGTIKKYSSFITSIGIYVGMETNFNNLEEFLAGCQNRTIFSKKQLIYLWEKYGNGVKLIKFIYYKELEKKVQLAQLRELGIVGEAEGPRPFSILTNEQFNKILELSNTSM